MMIEMWNQIETLKLILSIRKMNFKVNLLIYLIGIHLYKKRISKCFSSKKGT